MDIQGPWKTPGRSFEGASSAGTGQFEGPSLRCRQRSAEQHLQVIDRQAGDQAFICGDDRIGKFTL